MDKDPRVCKICKLNMPDGYLVFQNDYWRVRHSLETNIPGYCILEPRRHFLFLSEANGQELAEYGVLLSSIVEAEIKILQCKSVYTFSLAESVRHYHLHVIPIAGDFPSEYKGRGIMSYPLEPACEPRLVRNLVEVFQPFMARPLLKESD